MAPSDSSKTLTTDGINLIDEDDGSLNALLGIAAGLLKKFDISPRLVRFAGVALIAFGGLPIVAVFAF